MKCVTQKSGAMPNGKIEKRQVVRAICEARPLADVARGLCFPFVQRKSRPAQSDGASQWKQQRRNWGVARTNCHGHVLAQKHSQQGAEITCGTRVYCCGGPGFFGGQRVGKGLAVSNYFLRVTEPNGDDGLRQEKIEPHHSCCAHPVTIFVHCGAFPLRMKPNRHKICDDWGLVPSQFLCTFIESAIPPSPKAPVLDHLGAPPLATNGQGQMCDPSTLSTRRDDTVFRTANKTPKKNSPKMGCLKGLRSGRTPAIRSVVLECPPSARSGHDLQARRAGSESSLLARKLPLRFPKQTTLSQLCLAHWQSDMSM